MAENERNPQGGANLRLEIDDIPVPRLTVAVPIERGEIVALPIVAADRAAIGIGVEPDDIAFHGAAPLIVESTRRCTQAGLRWKPRSRPLTGASQLTFSRSRSIGCDFPCRRGSPQ